MGLLWGLGAWGIIGRGPWTNPGTGDLDPYLIWFLGWQFLHVCKAPIVYPLSRPCRSRLANFWAGFKPHCPGSRVFSAMPISARVPPDYQYAIRGHGNPLTSESLLPWGRWFGFLNPGVGSRHVPLGHRVLGVGKPIGQTGANAFRKFSSKGGTGLGGNWGGTPCAKICDPVGLGPGLGGQPCAHPVNWGTRQRECSSREEG